jgi:hypothetical protein
MRVGVSSRTETVPPRGRSGDGVAPVTQS